MPNCNCGYSTVKSFNFKRHLQRNPTHSEASVSSLGGSELTATGPSNCHLELTPSTPSNDLSKAPIPAEACQMSYLGSGIPQVLTPPTIYDTGKEAAAHISRIRSHHQAPVTVPNADCHSLEPQGDANVESTRLKTLESHMSQALQQIEILKSQVQALTSFRSDLCHVAMYHQKIH